MTLGSRDALKADLTANVRSSKPVPKTSKTLLQLKHRFVLLKLVDLGFAVAGDRAGLEIDRTGILTTCDIANTSEMLVSWAILMILA